MCYHNDFRIIFNRFLLQKNRNARIIFRKNTCHCRQCTCSVLQSHADVISAGCIANLLDWQVLVAAAPNASVAVEKHVARHIHNIAHNGTAGRQSPCTASVKHRIIHRIPMHKYGIKGIIDRCQGVVLRNHGRMYLYLNARFRILRNPQKLDAAAHFLCIAHILRCNFRNPFRKNIIKGNRCMERDRGHNSKLSAGIVALNIRRRVCLGIA